MRNMSDLQAHHLKYVVQEMYRYRRQSRGLPEKESHSWMLSAAAMADDVVQRVLECNPADGGDQIGLWKDKDDNTVVVTLVQAERDAYDLLKWRAENTQTNPFYDNGNRWFIANGGHRSAQRLSLA